MVNCMNDAQASKRRSLQYMAAGHILLTQHEKHQGPVEYHNTYCRFETSLICIVFLLVSWFYKYSDSILKKFSLLQLIKKKL